MSDAPPPRVAAVILAAGSSSRFGARNKLMEEVDGAPMVARVAALALGSGAAPVIAVTGFDAQKVAPPLRTLGVDIVRNPRFGDGLSSSLRAGLAELSAEIDGALILLGDMPRVEPTVLAALIVAFAAKGTRAICVPVHAGKRGNPVLWGRDHFPAMMELTGDRGAKSLMDLHAADVVEVEAGTGTIFTDFDLPSDLEQAARRD